MILTVQRKPSTDTYTEGCMFVDGLYFADTIEDTVRSEKIAGVTAIPAGSYQVILSQSMRFDKVLPEVLHVPGYLGIRIHSGNSAEDSSGCIIVGDRTGPGRIGASRDTMARLMTVLEHAIKVKGEQVQIEIK